MFFKKECHDDVTIVCANGILQFNSFVLAAMFPVLRGFLETPIQYDEIAVLMIPDLAVGVLETLTVRATVPVIETLSLV